jgi:hypothetical protein
MKRILFVALIIVALIPAYVLADSPLDAPVTRATINTIVINQFSYIGHNDVALNEIKILASFYGDGLRQTVDSITINNETITVKGMHSITLKKATGGFSGFPVAYQDAPATEILSNINAKTATYVQTSDLLYLENIVKVLLGL